MQGSTRSHKPNLKLGLAKIAHKNRLPKNSERGKESEISIEVFLDIDPSDSLFSENFEIKTTSEKEVFLSNEHSETNSRRKKGGSISPIDPLVRPRGLPILVP